MSKTKVVFVVVAMGLGATMGFAQETTGRLLVRTQVEGGEALPGVSVSIESPALIGGVHLSLTDDLGEALFLNLGPGAYTVRAELAGFGPQERRQVGVRLGATTALIVVMPAARFTDEITVLDEQPVVDPVQTGTEQVFDADYLSKTLVGTWGRFLSSPGYQVAGMTGGQAFFGSRRSENAWFVDGIDTTGWAQGDMGGGNAVMYGMDAYQEFEFKTGGYEAEFGRALGAVVSVVTKSGGNTFSGSLDARYRGDAFEESGEHYDPDLREDSTTTVEATLGGPILRDRLWFFVAYYRGAAESTPVDAPTSWKPTTTGPKAKLTWQASEAWRGTASYFGNTWTSEAGNSSRWTMPEATSFSESVDNTFSVGVDGVLSPSLLWGLRVGSDQKTYEARPLSGDLETILHYNAATNILSANYHTQEYDDVERIQAATDLTWFVSGPAGSHEVKGGLEVSEIDAKVELCSTGTEGGARCDPDIRAFQFEDYYIGGQDVPLWMWVQHHGGPKEMANRLRVAYLQDAWRPTPNLTVKAGLRYDRVTYEIEDGTEVADMARWQPRLGLAWDVSGDARNVVRASAGRYMDPATMNLVWSAAREWQWSRWWSCSTMGPQMGFDPALCAQIAGLFGYEWRTDREGWDPFGWYHDPASDVQGSAQTAIDPGLEAAYSDQLVLGYERALWPRSSVELSYVNKKTRGLFEDTCDGNVPVPGGSDSCDFYVMLNLPQLRRDYEAWIVRFESRTLDWLTVLASYTWSESKGDQYSLGFANDYDEYPWHWENRYGYLDNHYRHVLKVNGYFLLPWDVVIGFNAAWLSAWRWTPQADSFDIPEMIRGTYFVEPRGSREGYDSSVLDLQISKGIAIGATRLELLVSVLNVFSNEDVTGVCEAVRGCGEFELGEPTRWKKPRRWEVGLRLTF